MSKIDVKGTDCKLWISEHRGKDGNNWNSYSISVSRKDQNGQYVNAYQDVTFTRNAGMNESIINGTVFDFEGWMSVKVSKDRDGREVKKPIITINKANWHIDDDFDSFEQLEEDMPF